MTDAELPSLSCLFLIDRLLLLLALPLLLLLLLLLFWSELFLLALCELLFLLIGLFVLLVLKFRSLVCITRNLFNGFRNQMLGTLAGAHNLCPC